LRLGGYNLCKTGRTIENTFCALPRYPDLKYELTPDRCQSFQLGKNGLSAAKLLGLINVYEPNGEPFSERCDARAQRASFLDESISSILKQTLADFEFVILDDASIDVPLNYYGNGRCAISEYVFTKAISGSDSQAARTP